MRLARFLVPPPVAVSVLWACAALWIDGPGGALGTGLSLGFAVVALALFVRVRPSRLALALYGVLFGAVLAWWLSLAPSNDRDWLPDVARPPRARVEGDVITFTNVRNFRYRSETDYDESWEQRSYDLRELRGVDLYLSYWGSPWIAHTIMSWDFGGDEHLAISIETRKEKGEEYSAVRGFFRQFELYYVVADERDVVALRTSHRGEDVYLYRLAASPELARALLLDYVRELNELAERPVWYNALTTNCTTVIDHHVQNVAPRDPFDWRILVNGLIDQLAYERGNIDTSLPFEELRRRSAVSSAGRQAGDGPGFSREIRAGLPGFGS